MNKCASFWALAPVWHRCYSNDIVISSTPTLQRRFSVVLHRGPAGVHSADTHLHSSYSSSASPMSVVFHCRSLSLSSKAILEWQIWSVYLLYDNIFLRIVLLAVRCSQLLNFITLKVTSYFWFCSSLEDSSIHCLFPPQCLTAALGAFSHPFWFFSSVSGRCSGVRACVCIFCLSALFPSCSYLWCLGSLAPLGFGDLALYIDSALISLL